MRLILYIIFLPLCLNAGVRIGNEALIATPSSASYYRCGGTGRQPDDASVQGINPPVFSWLYYEDASLLPPPYNQTRAFKLELTTNGSFASPLWSFVTSNNFFNFLPSITNADGSTWTGTCSWRVTYMNSNATVNLATNPVQTFTMTSGATKWDRTCFSDVTYLASLTNHHILFAESNQPAFSLFVRTNLGGQDVPGVGLSTYTNYQTYIYSDVWTNTSAITNSSLFQHFPVITAILGIAYHSDTNQAFTNTIHNASPSVGTVLTNWAMNIMTQRLDQIESYQGNTIQDMWSFALSYRLFRDIMTSGQRQQCIDLADSWINFMIQSDWIYSGSTVATNRVYTNNLVISYASHAKLGDNHAKNDQVILALCLAFADESAVARWGLDWSLGYYIAVFDPFQASDDGLGYSTVQDFAQVRQYTPWVMANMFFAGKGLTNAPIWTKVADMMQHQQPTGFRVRGDPYGQVNAGVPDPFNKNSLQWCYTHFFVHACLMQRGDYLRQYRRMSTLNNGFTGDAEWFQALAKFHWPVPTEADCSTNGFVDINNGWAMANSKLPTDYDAHSNAFHVVLEARASGAGRNNSDWCEGQIVFNAYGAEISSAGSGAYEQANIFHNGLYVDGVGVNNESPPVAYPVLSKITAFTNAADFFYMKADLTYAFNITNWAGDGSGNLQSSSGRANTEYRASSNARPYIVSVTREVLAPHKKYLCIYDSFVTTQAAQFQFKWNVWDSNAVVDASAMSATWTATNNFNLSNVTVYLQQVVQASTVGVTNMHNAVNLPGSNNVCAAKINPFTGENYAGTNDWYCNPNSACYDVQNYWANTLWFYNKTATTNWHFFTTIYPKAWYDSGSAPVIARLDDQTVKVTLTDGSIDTNTFNTNYSSAFTFMVGISGSTPPPPPPTMIQVAKGAGKMKLSGKAKIQ